MIMRKKGFTLVELLIVIAIIALLMGILMPALARVRMYAYRMTCGTNLSGIGKAIMLYANDARGEAYPMPGVTNLAGYAYSTPDNGYLVRWFGGNPGVAGVGTAAYVYNTATAAAPSNGGAGHATIGSIFYLLVKYQDVAVKQFICKGDVGVKAFKLTDSISSTITEFSKAWDFGADPGKYCSYSYHNPFSPTQDGNPTSRASGFPVGSSSPPAMPLAADRNPTLDRNVTYLDRANILPGGQPEPLPESGKRSPKHYWDTGGGPGCQNCTYQDPDLVWNSFAHQREGQNVLFNDGHVAFERTANVGIDNDNIWQSWPTVPLTAYAKYEREVGGYFAKGGTAATPYTTPVWGILAGTWFPRAAEDSLLISDQQDTPAHTW
jgi:prepilin-type N-terminal cleavage/methylation domain-containing protein/prepilin-type processing-associated H-X9-DG protein